MEPLIISAIVLTVSFAFSELFYHANYPRLIGHLVGGVSVGIIITSFLPGAPVGYFDFFSEIGLIFLLLLVGLEIDIKKFRKTSKYTVIEAFFSSMVPLALGYACSYYLFPILFDIHISKFTAFIIGGTMSVTAEGTKASILLAMKKIKTRIGGIMLGAGIVDDILEIFLIAFISVKIHTSKIGSLILLPLELFAFLILCYVIFKIIPYLMSQIEREQSDISSFATAIIIGIFIAALSSSMGFGVVIGAFIAGIMLQIIHKDKKEENRLIKNIKLLTIGLILPFFFVSIGLHVDIVGLFNNLPMFFLIVSIAIIGKLLGSIIAGPFTKMSLKQAVLVGWGMNSRGAIELVIAHLALINGFITPTIYSAIIGMAVITTLIFPFVLTKYLKKYPHIMD